MIVKILSRDDGERAHHRCRENTAGSETGADRQLHTAANFETAAQPTQRVLELLACNRNAVEMQSRARNGVHRPRLAGLAQFLGAAIFCWCDLAARKATNDGLIDAPNLGFNRIVSVDLEGAV